MKIEVTFIRNLLRKFPTKVIIREMRGGTVRYKFDRAARIKRSDGTAVMEFKSNNDTFPAPSFEYYGINNKGQAILELFSPKAGVYQPVKFAIDENEESKLILSDSKVDEWLALEQMRLAELTKPDSPWWQINFPLIVMMVMGGIFAFVLIMTFGPLTTIASQITATSQNILSTAQLQGQMAAGAIIQPPPAIG